MTEERPTRPLFSFTVPVGDQPRVGPNRHVRSPLSGLTPKISFGILRLKFECFSLIT